MVKNSVKKQGCGQANHQSVKNRNRAEPANERERERERYDITSKQTEKLLELDWLAAFDDLAYCGELSRVTHPNKET